MNLETLYIISCFAPLVVWFGVLVADVHLSRRRDRFYRELGKRYLRNNFQD